MKLDRLISRHDSLGRATALRMIASRRVKVDGVTIVDGHHMVDRFSQIELDGKPLQQAGRPLYMMVHKPVGYVSATMDAELPTVLDLVNDASKHELHIAGRLDRNTSGLMLLTNDGRWSKSITESIHGVPKVYEVETAEVLKPDDVAAFAAGFYFHTEDITTKPARLEILGPQQARVTLMEGRYHQVKRMFHRVNNRVTGLHRSSIGAIVLPVALKPGQWRWLTAEEAASFALP
ncbi:MAG: rRNA pseudouridine synthase [Verrucomicrobiaceae bacterium]|nr:rRNA pseudouridine synthase [Verrucomicrobiaceae bacterium]